MKISEAITMLKKADDDKFSTPEAFTRYEDLMPVAMAVIRAQERGMPPSEELPL